MSTPDLITIERAAEICSVCTRTIRNWISQDRLKAYYIGPRLLRVDYEDLREFWVPVHNSYTKKK